MTTVECVGQSERLDLPRSPMILVHCALSKVGHIDGGAIALVNALAQFVGPGGTVMFPTLTGEEKDPSKLIRFDVREPSASWVGKVPLASIDHPDGVRSLHPTHSVTAIGKDARWLTEGHGLSESPCGENSPYRRLAEGGGYIVLIGCGHHANTSLHAAEEHAGVPYHLLPGMADYESRDAEGKLWTGRTRLHKWHGTSDLDRAEALLVGIQKIGTLGGAQVRIIPATKQFELIVDSLRADPNCLRKEGSAP